MTAPMPIAFAIALCSDSARSGFFCVDDFPGADDGFVEHFPQRHVLARTRFHQLAVVPENAAKSDVAKIRGVTLAPCDLENLFEMQRLRRADDIPNRVRL